MSDDFYSSMYGPRKAAPAQPVAKPEAPKVIPPAHQRLSGLKLTNGHMHEVEINGRYVTIPSAAYIKLLEDQIKEFRTLTRQQGEDLRRATRSIQRAHVEIEKLKIAMASTIKSKSYRGN